MAKKCKEYLKQVAEDFAHLEALKERIRNSKSRKRATLERIKEIKNWNEETIIDKMNSEIEEIDNECKQLFKKTEGAITRLQRLFRIALEIANWNPSQGYKELKEFALKRVKGEIDDCLSTIRGGIENLKEWREERDKIMKIPTRDFRKDKLNEEMESLGKVERKLEKMERKLKKKKKWLKGIDREI